MKVTVKMPMRGEVGGGGITTMAMITTMSEVAGGTTCGMAMRKDDETNNKARARSCLSTCGHLSCLSQSYIMDMSTFDVNETIEALC